LTVTNYLEYQQAIAREEANELEQFELDETISEYD